MNCTYNLQWAVKQKVEVVAHFLLGVVQLKLHFYPACPQSHSGMLYLWQRYFSTENKDVQ